MKRPKSIEISEAELREIFGEDVFFFNEILSNVFCANCEEHLTTIVNFTILLKDSSDITLSGYCQKCKKPVARFIETGENPEKKDRALRIWSRHFLIMKTKQG